MLFFEWVLTLFYTAPSAPMDGHHQENLQKMRIDLAWSMQPDDMGRPEGLDRRICSRSTKKMRVGLAWSMQPEDRGRAEGLDIRLCSRSTKKIRIGLARSMQPEDRRSIQTGIPPIPPVLERGAPRIGRLSPGPTWSMQSDPDGLPVAIWHRAREYRYTIRAARKI